MVSAAEMVAGVDVVDRRQRPLVLVSTRVVTAAPVGSLRPAPGLDTTDAPLAGAVSPWPFTPRLPRLPRARLSTRSRRAVVARRPRQARSSEFAARRPARS